MLAQVQQSFSVSTTRRRARAILHKFTNMYERESLHVAAELGLQRQMLIRG